MNKLLLTGFTLVLLIAGTTAVLAATTTTTTTTGPTTVEDISGPCDEPEHATDPRCAGAGGATTGAVAGDDDHGGGDRLDDDRGRGRDHPEDDGVLDDDRDKLEPGADISGPCDEAEHAGDPRCTSVGTPVDDLDDNSGPSANSGPGSLSSGHDDSFDDDGFDDHGGSDDSSGPGGGDDDSSGPGGGDDD